MPENIAAILPELWLATGQTFLMLAIGLSAAVLIGGPLGVLLCDEPTSALDPDTTRALLETLRDINRRLGVTIVIVSHELAVLGAICNRVAVIEDGAIAEQFALADTSIRRTALGRELAQYARAPARLGAVHA